MDSARTLSASIHGYVTIVEVTKRRILDDQVIAWFETDLVALVQEQSYRSLAIDFHKVEYLSSSAIGKLFIVRQLLRTFQGRLALCNLEASIYEAFKITGFNRLFVIKDTLDEAVQCVAA